MTNDDHLYRRGVGVMLLNRDGKVLVGARIDNPADAWQMPQGGLDEGEDPWTAALRARPELLGELHWHRAAVANQIANVGVLAGIIQRLIDRLGNPVVSTNQE